MRPCPPGIAASLRSTPWTIIVALAVLVACSGDGGYRSPTAPAPSPPTASEWVDYVGEATTSQGGTLSLGWKVRITQETIDLRLNWGQRVEFFNGQINDRTFSAIAHPPYLDECCDVVELRLSGSFSQDLSSFDATMISILGNPETDRREMRWHARRL